MSESAGMPRTPNAARSTVWRPASRSVWTATYSFAIADRKVVRYWRWIFFPLLLCLPALANDPGGGTNGVGADVTLSVSGTTAALANGVITAKIDTTTGRVTSYLLYGTQMLDTSGLIYYSMDGGTSYEQPGNCVLSVITNTADMVDISCKVTWANFTNRLHAFDIDVHYVLRRGDTGLYGYVILAHPPGYPAASYGEWRLVWKLPHNSTDWTFERLYVDGLRNWYWGTYSDFLNEASTDIAEVKLITTGARAGQYDCKYEYSAQYQDIGCWGHASDTNKIGVWMVLGGYDYLNDGPTKNELTVAESYTLLHFGRDHYNGSGLSVAAGESWTKMYGPFLFYCNKTSATSRPGDALWADAQAQVQAEIGAWPYSWLTYNTNYPVESVRGAVSGKLVITDQLKPALAAGPNSWIGLSRPDPGGNWQFESKRYQYWVHPDAVGNFVIPHVRPGAYTLSAFTVGAVDEFSWTNITVSAGTTSALGPLNGTVFHPGGQIAWEIGVPDRTAAEFRHGTNYWYPFLWDTFSNEFTNPLEYTVGTSNWTNDWNYVQPGYEVGTNWYPWKWRIHFTLTNLPNSGSATLTFAWASANYGAVQIFVNDESTVLGEVDPTCFGGPTGGNALIREGIHAKYGVDYFSVPLSSLRVGANTITLVQRSINGAFNHVMYDYLNLELPASVVLPPGLALTWRGGNNGNAWDLASTTNWITTNGTATTFTNGDNVTFDNSGAPNLSITENALLQPGSVTVISSNNYTFNGAAGVGALNGPMPLIKAGSGTLTVNSTNGFSGPVLLSGGRINMGVSGALGTGILQLSGGTIQLNNGGTLLNAVNVTAPSTITTTGNSYINGAISGGSTLTVASGNVLTFQASVANFTGTVAMGSSSGYLRFNQPGTLGVPNGIVDAGTGTATIENRLVGGGTIYLGALTGGPNTKLKGTDQSSYPGSVDTCVIGVLNLDTTFAGTIGDTAHIVAIRKVGTGTWTLTGASAYSGLTAVGAGTLALSGSITTTNFIVVSNAATLNLSGTITANTVQIDPGGTMTDCGTINGNLANNGTVTAACGPGQSLVISGNVTNNGTMQFLAGTGLQVSGVFVNNGVLDLITAAQTLPANFLNNGMVLDRHNVQLLIPIMSGPDLLIGIQSYAGHGYQLQRSDSLAPAVWQNLGPAQDGTGAVLNFTDPGAAARGAGFYRLQVYP